MADFEAAGSEPNALPISIKVRVSSGCFHREHSPEAYHIIDSYLRSNPLDSRREQFIEHESGPELLVYLAVTTAGLTLAKSVVELVTAIIKARSEGAKKGDRPRDSLEILVRGFRKDDEYAQETVIRVEDYTEVDSEVLDKALDKAFKALPKPNRRSRNNPDA
jgi:hypothetical protein